MLSHTSCPVCGRGLGFLDESEEMECFYCHDSFPATEKCEMGHSVCESCQQLSGEDLIEIHCIRSTETDPFFMAFNLLNNPSVRIHGPDHHFLVPAVLLSAYYNKHQDEGPKEKAIKTARKRAHQIKDGFCGLFGDCGAAVGTGIFVSIITGATPLSHEDWRLSNLMTARSLQKIAVHGGPRCCKRNTFLALKSAVDFLRGRIRYISPGRG